MKPLKQITDRGYEGVFELFRRNETNFSNNKIQLRGFWLLFDLEQKVTALR
ncbi:hypothetical protein [Microscilla marina]|uniref:Uncharacterized protein n=1 Tax=Microscilla marina ATCC 23134 TaxID=313606 RepID=A1ZCU1_MICM2|nr:hypothetical protein [Microscilla marina]EAY32093.1 hypothetical protein M23134_02122 [Microscilla marina ATCC 23134]